MTLEQKLRSLLDGEFSSLSIEFNGHSSSYIHAREAILEDRYYEGAEWVSDAEKDMAIALNSVWTIQWYPSTPVGFCLLAASSLEALLARAFEEIK